MIRRSVALSAELRVVLAMNSTMSLVMQIANTKNNASTVVKVLNPALIRLREEDWAARFDELAEIFGCGKDSVEIIDYVRHRLERVDKDCQKSQNLFRSL